VSIFLTNISTDVTPGPWLHRKEPLLLPAQHLEHNIHHPGIHHPGIASTYRHTKIPGMAESLTMNLRMELERTNLQFTRWTNCQKDWLETNDNNYNDKLEELHVTIQALKDNDGQLEASKNINQAIKRSQESELEQCDAQNSLLEKQREILETQLGRCTPIHTHLYTHTHTTHTTHTHTTNIY
jgi:hypothetical protein